MIQHPTFGTKARRKKLLRRWVTVAWVLSMGAALAGIPGANLGVDTIQRFAESPARRGFEASESTNGLIEFRRQVFEARPKPPKPKPTPSPTPTIDIGEEATEESAPDTSTASAPAEETTEATPATQETETSTASSGSITDIIYSAAARHGLDGAYLVSVADCESSLNPNAVSPAGYHGLFQFDYTTWNEFGSGSIYDPAAQAEAAAGLIAGGQASRWPSCA